MESEELNTIPPTITAGDSARWADTAANVSGRVISSPDWSLSYVFRGPASAEVDATPANGGWETVLPATTFAALPAGVYSWFRLATNGAERITIGQGRVTVKPDPMSIEDGTGQVSTAAQAYADCEKALATFSKSGGMIKKYTIGSRDVEFQSLADLLKVLNYWRLRVANESAAESVAAGRANPFVLYARFRR